MFNQIARYYDFLNHVLSFGIDRIWRKKLVDAIVIKEEMKVLDVATGTGDLLIEIKKRIPNCEAIGVDLAEEMLSIARKKSSLLFKRDDACNLSFSENRFDLLTISFGIRNVEDPEKALREFFRILKPGGQLLILEFSIPSNLFIKGIYLFYFRYILPSVGRLVSKNKKAYRYLNQTVEAFKQGESFSKLIQKSGFTEVVYSSLTFGVVTLYKGKK
jgi:demethylmenaquinone methyltransferase/2-methoxy-6-polyprenyl-1,4-benzoquinol methylase